MNRVHIELQRVQSWLFAVPRLRAMVGANALLGETLRVALPKLASKTEDGWKLAPSSETYPVANDDDPLKEHDDPARDAKEGILARDGGHFEAQFEKGADAFADAADKLLRSSVPGLRFRIKVDDNPCTTNQVYLSTELPVFAPCQWTGRGLASAIVPRGNPNDGDYEEHPVSLDAKARDKAGERASNGSAQDVASLLSVKTNLSTLRRALELKELVGNRYLALIHADGNGVGSGIERDRPHHEHATFFHENRVLLRRAVKAAIDDACNCAKDKTCKDESAAPLVPLMLGGDDLLLVCRARVALPFVVKLCETLDAIQKDRTNFKLTLGVGVVIAKHTIPIHRLHEVAEQLASSAKRRVRGLKDAGEKSRSVVDWAVYSTSWVDDPKEVRQRDWLRGSGTEMRVLSQRPVDVLGQGLDSLEGLVNRAEHLRYSPRSQLRYLVDQLPRGRSLSELAFAELPQEAKGPLAEAGVTTPWRSAGKVSLTSLLDLVEVSEIARLGRKSEHANSQPEAAHVQ